MTVLPRWDALPGDAERCVAAIDAWTAALFDTGVVAAFQNAPLRGPAPGRTLDALDAFAAANWDFRGGRERNLARVPDFTAAQLAAIDASTAALGLDGTPPPSRRHYDAVVMTGGMVRAGIVKPRYLRELADAGLDWNEGVFLGGFRPFAGDEVELAPRLGVDGDNEVDAMAAGMRQAFGLAGAPASERSEDGKGAEAWRDLSWVADGRTLRVVAAPSSEPAVRRANTADTYRFWAGRALDARSVLVITTPVYVPYQGAAAIEILGLEFGFSVETVAVSRTASDLGTDTQQFLPHHRLQELRSAVQGMRNLRSRLTGGCR
ncbi:hypothetical protein GCM10022239_16930 [Leifsonia bigeumensis]|uniref:Uncharacterized protein n=1 Tax=Leifsonella bigeumensis TaxID=433643 RepID=A0ABP7FLA2_9MICO